MWDGLRVEKVLLIMPVSTLDWGSKNAGGVDSVCQLLLKHLAERRESNFQYRVLAFDPFSEKKYTGELINFSANVEVVCCPVNEKRFGLPVPSIVSTVLRVKEQVKSFSPDIVHSHGIAWLLGAGKKHKKILTLHGYKKIGRKPVSRTNDFLYEVVVPWLSKFNVDRYTCVGEALRSALANDVKEPISIIGNPVDEVYLSSRLRRKPNDSVIRLVTCALISRKKGIDRAIDLAAELKQWGHSVALKIVGPNVDNSYYKQLLDLVDSLGLSEEVEFTGPLNRHQIVNEYSKADIGVFFSEEETFGLVPLEMLAAGLPLFATPVGILQERRDVFENLGVQFLDPDTGSAAEKIMNLLRGQPEKILGYINSCFCVNSVALQYEELYSE